MTRLRVPAGTPIAVATRRLKGRNLWVPGAPTSDGADLATSSRPGTVITASATPHTKGSYSQIIAATAGPTNLVTVMMAAASNTAATDTSTLMDIAIGAAASEVVVAPNIPVGGKAAPINAPVWQGYVDIPQGSRVAARIQSVVVSKTVSVIILLQKVAYDKAIGGPIVDMGTDLATSKGVTITAPGATNTKGAWTQITAATPQPFSALSVGNQFAATTVQSGAFMLVDIGYGASGAEVILAPDILGLATTSESASLIGPLVFPGPIPAGTRLAARYARSAGATGLDIILYGTPSR